MAAASAMLDCAYTRVRKGKGDELLQRCQNRLDMRLAATSKAASGCQTHQKMHLSHAQRSV